MREQLQLYNEKCFIRGWYLNSNICDALIEYFERSNHKFAGSTSTGINKKIKDSTDCTLGQSEIRNEYVRELTFVAKEYMKIYPYVNEYSEWGIIERINIQKYEPKQGYYGWHTDHSLATYHKPSFNSIPSAETLNNANFPLLHDKPLYLNFVLASSLAFE